MLAVCLSVLQFPVNSGLTCADFCWHLNLLRVVFIVFTWVLLCVGPASPNIKAVSSGGKGLQPVRSFMSKPLIVPVDGIYMAPEEVGVRVCMVGLVWCTFRVCVNRFARFSARVCSIGDLELVMLAHGLL